MSALRAALHRCADLIADAMEEDAARAAGGKAPLPKKRPIKERAPRVRLPDVDPFTKARAEAALRRAGLG